MITHTSEGHGESTGGWITWKERGLCGAKTDDLTT